MPLKKDEKQEVIKSYARVEGDTGSPEVQIALLHKGIEHLKQHLDEHKHDVPAKRGLLSKIAKRRRLLRYLASRNEERYHSLTKALDLKK